MIGADGQQLDLADHGVAPGRVEDVYGLAERPVCRLAGRVQHAVVRAYGGGLHADGGRNVGRNVRVRGRAGLRCGGRPEYS